jgi:polysaccharide deacetylase family protein (PEP-CTERM system associated)
MKILTFDIEDWFHVLDNAETADPNGWSEFSSRIEIGVDRILQLLSDTGQPATFFCLGWVAVKYPNIIRKIKRNGHHIASHSHTHQLAYNQSQAEFEEDLKLSIDSLQQLVGDKIDTYRAPGFSITANNLWAFESLDMMGIINDCSIFPASRAHGGLSGYSCAVPSKIFYQGVTMNSLPINTTRILGQDIVYSGGGYFRLLPLWYLKKRFNHDQYIMTYFHPRDFDPDQPMIPGLSISRKFKSYVGLRGALGKLERILSSHRFLSVDMAVNEIDWLAVNTVDLG